MDRITLSSNLATGFVSRLAERLLKGNLDCKINFKAVDVTVDSGKATSIFSGTISASEKEIASHFNNLYSVIMTITKGEAGGMKRKLISGIVSKLINNKLNTNMSVNAKNLNVVIENGMVIINCVVEFEMSEGEFGKLLYSLL